MQPNRANRRPELAPIRYATIVCFDVVATLAGLYLALVFRLAGELPIEFATGAKFAAPLLVLVRLVTNLGARLHRWSFRMSGLPEASRLVVATLVGSIAFVVLFRTLSSSTLPRTVYLLEFFLTTSLMGAFRFAPRVLEDWYADRLLRSSGAAERTIIVGAGNAGDLLARDLIRSHDARYFVLGFVDDDPGKQGVLLDGKAVLGTISDLPRLIGELRVGMVLLAIPSLPAERVREILSMCASSKASFKIIPASFAQLDERVSAAMLHDLSPEDLLPRDPVAFDYDEIRALVQNRRVLVTGAGGSIGAEICHQLAFHGVSHLVMVDMNENELYLLARRLHDECPAMHVYAEVADIRELSRLHRLGDEYSPELVFHAAAHKHVPLMEDAPEEAVKNNVFGTLNVCLMADRCGAEQLVVISTDKAVNPTSVMGATKRIAELVVRDLARRSATRMTAVRFGNVLGSAGSVVPLFKQQIERGGPVTVTHPECTRYFMTVSEAVGLVLLAGLGKYGDLCVLDMGEPFRISELAANLITMAGRIPGKEVPIVYTGLRPGEKLHEELLTEEEEHTSQVRNRISVATSPPPPPDLAKWLHELHEAAEVGDREALLQGVEALVPTYRRTPGRPIEPVRAEDFAGPALATPDATPAHGTNGVKRRPALEWVHALTGWM